MKNKKNNWICGKCEQEKLNNPNAEVIPKHFRRCPKRILDEQFNIKRDGDNKINFNF